MGNEQHKDTSTLGAQENEKGNITDHGQEAERTHPAPSEAPTKEEEDLNKDSSLEEDDLDLEEDDLDLEENEDLDDEEEEG